MAIGYNYIIFYLVIFDIMQISVYFFFIVLKLLFQAYFIKAFNILNNNNNKPNL